MRRLWLFALAVALVYTAVDSSLRLTTIESLASALSGVPALDPHSPTGYVHGERALVLPSIGADGLHWIMQAQLIVNGQTARVRHVDYDNAPYGRDAHWSSLLPWWLATLAWVNHAFTGTPVPIAVESVAPYANTLLFVFLLVLVIPLVARRFGTLPAAVLALGIVWVNPFFVSFIVGDVDHHGLATSACLLTVLFAIAGGAGWVRDHPPDGGVFPSSSDGVDFAAWLPTRTQARRWFIASGIAGGAGLWISAATETPVLIGVAVGAVLATGWMGRNRIDAEPGRPDPTLWRVWGAAGAAASVGFYLLEYFPSHFGWRLEVNHPLFALSWLGGSELVCWTCRTLHGERTVATSRQWLVLGVSIIAAATLPVVIALTHAQTFWVADRFLWTFHERYIGEFGRFSKYWSSSSWDDLLRDVNVLPVVCIAAPLLFWRRLPRAAKALLLLGWPAGLFTIALMLRQTRWMIPADAVWLSVLPITVAILWPLCTRRPNRALAAVALACVLLPAPAIALRNWNENDWQDPIYGNELHSLVTRAVAQSMRSARPDGPMVVLSDPSATTQLIYFGGMRGIGTLYWENMPGLKATTEIFAAPTAERAHELLTERGITDIVIFSWDPFFRRAAALLRPGADSPSAPDDGFFVQLFNTGILPPWLRARSYPLPKDDRMKGEWVEIFDVALPAAR